MPDWLNAIILGIVEGITEFLPISSTGHLIVTAELLRFQEPPGTEGTFQVVIQGGAILAVIAYYLRDLTRQARTIHRDRDVQRLWLGVALAFVPAAILGFLFGDRIKEALFTPSVVAYALIVGGILMYLVERIPRKPVTRDLESVRLLQAFGVGCAQTLALLWPGFSRSASSILGGMMIGLDRPTATKFSFYLSIPTLGLATLYDFAQNADVLMQAGLTNMIIGFVVSFVVAYFVIGWLLRYVSKNDFRGFAIYRIAIGVVILLLVWMGVMPDRLLA